MRMQCEVGRVKRGMTVVMAGVLLLMAAAPALAKPTPPIELAITASPSDLAIGGTATVTLEFTPGVDVYRAEVRFDSSSDEVELTGAATLDAGSLAMGNTYSASVPIRLTGSGRTEIRGWVYAFDENDTLMFGRSTALYIVASDAGVLAGDTSFIDLEISAAQEQLAAKTLSQDAYRDRVSSLVGSKAITEVSYEPVPAGEKSGAKALAYLTGAISWTDSGGSTHNVRPSAKVEVYERNAGGDELITTATWSGYYYYAQFENIDPENAQPGRDIFIRVYTDSPYTRVYNATSGDTYFLESAVVNDVPDDVYTYINVTANNTNTPDRAFCVFDALHTVVTYSGQYLTGGYLNKIDVDFPTSDSTSNYSGGILHILMADWIDWDVIHHEFGHYFMDVRNIEANPGGEHGLNENLAERLGKDEGIRLAWGEGFPTYYGTVAQALLFDSSLNIVNVGDTEYTDTIDSTIDYDLEGSAGATSMGEDNEISVQRVLWDLYDAAEDGEDKVAIGHAAVYNAAVSVNATTLSAFWNGLIAAKAATMKQKVAYGCIFGEHKVASELKSPADDAEPTATPHTFDWELNGAGPSFRLNKFRVQFWKDDLSAMVFESAELNGPTYTPTQGDWDTIFANDKSVRWVVTGKNDSAPETGTYVSCSRRVGRADIAFVIDDTGSMYEEIGGVRNALTAYIGVLELLDSNVTIHLITFKDNVTSRIMSNDLPAVQAQVNTLFADGGGDCPEASVEAMNFAVPTLWPGGTILLATDADAHAGLDIGATIAALRANGTRVNVLLSGSCSESYKTNDGADIPASINCETCGDAEKDYSPSAISLYTTLAAETGGIFAFVPDVNAGGNGPTRYLNTAVNVMKSTNLPAIPVVSPPFNHRGATFTIIVTGANTNFNNSSVLTFSGTGITVNSGETTSPISYTANITVAPDAEIGFRDVTVTTDLGKATIEEAVGVGAFEVKDTTPDPTIVGVDPAVVLLDTTFDIDIYGVNTNFASDSTVTFTASNVATANISVNTVTVISPTLLRANITVPVDAAIGYYSVAVSTPSASGEFALEYVPGPLLVVSYVDGGFPRILSIDPDSTIRDIVLNVYVTGQNTNFQDGVSVGSISGDGVTVLSTTVTDSTHATLSVDVDAAATLGFRDVFVTTGDEVAAILDAFEVTGATLVASAGPDQTINTAASSVDVALDGSGSVSQGAPIVAYHWTGTPDPDDVVSPVVSLGQGVHVFTLVVENSDAIMSAPDSVTITITNETPADIDSSGVVDAVDVQLVINGALDIDVGGLNTDVDGSSDTDAVDVQLVINAALGL